MNWLMSIVSLAASAITIFTPQISGAIGAHPKIATVIASIFAIFAHVMPSPTGAAVVTATGETGTATAVK